MLRQSRPYSCKMKALSSLFLGCPSSCKKNNEPLISSRDITGQKILQFTRVGGFKVIAREYEFCQIWSLILKLEHNESSFSLIEGKKRLQEFL